jgi:hypothetical protein
MSLDNLLDSAKIPSNSTCAARRSVSSYDIFHNTFGVHIPFAKAWITFS